MIKLKVNDKVRIRTGKDKGREGKIERIFPKKKMVLIPEINVYKKHVKGDNRGIKGGIYDIPRPILISKVALVCPNCKKATRVGMKVVGKEKVRVCKRCKKEISVK